MSHDRYFVDRLATRIVEVSNGTATLYPGTYSEYLWSKERGRGATGAATAAGAAGAPPTAGVVRPIAAASPTPSVHSVRAREEQKRALADKRKRDKAFKALSERIAALETRIAECERSIKELESSMAAPGFYDRRDEAKPVIDQHQALMWQVGDLLNQWEMLQGEAQAFTDQES